MATYLVVKLNDIRIGLRAETIVHVLHAVEISPLPGAPPDTLGIINLHGTIVPVLDLRARLGLAPHALRITDHIVVARTKHRMVAVVADHSDGIVDQDAAPLTDARTVLPGIRHVAGLAVDAGGVVFIHDLDAFLSLEEDQQLARAVAGVP